MPGHGHVHQADWFSITAIHVVEGGLVLDGVERSTSVRPPSTAMVASGTSHTDGGADHHVGTAITEVGISHFGSVGAACDMAVTEKLPVVAVGKMVSGDGVGGMLKLDGADQSAPIRSPTTNIVAAAASAVDGGAGRGVGVSGVVAVAAAHAVVSMDEQPIKYKML